MNKTAFTGELYHLLKSLPKAERQQHIDFYEEMIDDRMEDGLSEEEAVAALGSAADIAAQILGETPAKPARKIPVWGIVLIVLGSPVWLTLLLTVAASVLTVVILAAASAVTVYLLLWSLIAALYAADLALAAGSAAGIIGGVYYLVHSITAPGFLFLGGALACAGGTILLFFLCNFLAVWLFRLGKWSVRKTAGLFRRKDGKK